MVKSKLRYYTYKITFKDLPKYFYYGKHKDKGKPYFGSPKTWKHLWDQFEPEIQILQWYETEEEVRVNEKKIIDATWKDRYSLNEHNNSGFSEESNRKGGKIGGRKNTPKQQATRKENGKSKSPSQQTARRENGKKLVTHKEREKWCSQGGNANTEKQRLARSSNGRNNIEAMNSHANTAEARKNNVKIMNSHPNTIKSRTNSGKIGGKIAGNLHTPAQRRTRKKNAKTTNNQKWMCKVTGHISSPGGLSRYQIARGIDTSNRVKVS